MDFHSDDLKFIVAAASIAGYLEAEDIICIENDRQLTTFILEKYMDYRKKEWMSFSFHSYMRNQLIKEFGYKEDDNE